MIMLVNDRGVKNSVFTHKKTFNDKNPAPSRQTATVSNRGHCTSQKPFLSEYGNLSSCSIAYPQRH
jgi:hypothetical protein